MEMMNEMTTTAVETMEKKSRKKTPSSPVPAQEQEMIVAVTEPETKPEAVPVDNIETEMKKRGRGRPAFDRTVMMEETINAIRKEFPNQAIFSRSDLMQLALPVSYVLNFVKVGATKVRGLYVVPAKYRNLWPNYSQMLQKELKDIYNH